MLSCVILTWDAQKFQTWSSRRNQRAARTASPWTRSRRHSQRSSLKCDITSQTLFWSLKRNKEQVHLSSAYALFRYFSYDITCEWSGIIWNCSGSFEVLRWVERRYLQTFRRSLLPAYPVHAVRQIGYRDIHWLTEAFSRKYFVFISAFSIPKKSSYNI
jgi:hypothetical protein